MINLNKLPIDQILKSYAFPHRFYVRFTVAAAEKALIYAKEVSPESLKAIDLAKRFSLGENIPQEELKASAASATSSASSAAHAAYAASYAAYAASYAAYAASYAAYAANAAASSASAASYAASSASSSAAREKCTKDLKTILIEMIKIELTEFELIMLSVE